MLRLDHLQSSLAQSVLLARPFATPQVLTAGRADPLARLRIYQNNTRSSLTAVLMAVFPVTVRLVDERFFRFIASEFIRRCPPSESRLARYGGGFPRFLKSIDTLADLPIVAETARLEWAIAEALDDRSLPGRALAELESRDLGPDLRFALQPSLRLVISHWSVLSAWMAHQDSRIAMPSGGWPRHAERVALWRSGETVRLKQLGRAEFTFRHALKHGFSLQQAAERALARTPQFDPVPALVGLFDDGLVTAVHAAETIHPH